MKPYIVKAKDYTKIIAFGLIFSMITTSILVGIIFYNIGVSNTDAFDRGMQDHYNENYDNGYKNGTEKGELDGIEEGENDGEYNGYEDGFEDGTNSLYHYSRDIQPIIDGLIETNEWLYASFILTSYHADEIYGGNGYEYIYIGQNATHLFVGLDLCSDRDFYNTTRWFGCFFNVELISFNETNFSSALGNGLDSIIYNIKDNAIAIGGNFDNSNDSNIYGNSTISGVNVATSFGKSINSDVDHRMIEMSIPVESFSSNFILNTTISGLFVWSNPFRSSYPFNSEYAYYTGLGESFPTNSLWYYPLPLDIPRLFLGV